MKDNGQIVWKMEKVMFKRIFIGVYYYPNGDKLEGEWKKNRLEGKGILNCNWLGVYYYESGEVFEGEWEDGVRNGGGT